MSFESGESASIMANINQQQGRLKLIRDIGIDKQQRDVRMVFDLFGAETERCFSFLRCIFLVIKLYPDHLSSQARDKRVRMCVRVPVK